MSDQDIERDDKIQHGIDDDPNNDAEKGAALGGIGGAVTGAVAGSMAGPVGTVIGAIAGGAVGAAASGAAVGAVDRVDNDDTISGIGHGATTNADTTADHIARDVDDSVPGNRIPGIQTGGHDADGTPDTRGITEKVADAVTGDKIDDKTGKPVH